MIRYTLTAALLSGVFFLHEYLLGEGKSVPPGFRGTNCGAIPMLTQAGMHKRGA